MQDVLTLTTNSIALVAAAYFLTALVAHLHQRKKNKGDLPVSHERLLKLPLHIEA